MEDFALFHVWLVPHFGHSQGRTGCLKKKSVKKEKIWPIQRNGGISWPLTVRNKGPNIFIYYIIINSLKSTCVDFSRQKQHLLNFSTLELRDRLNYGLPSLGGQQAYCPGSNY